MKIALVTASTKGIGKAIGKALLETGCFVFFNYSSDEIAAEKLEEEIGDPDGIRHALIKSDMSSVSGMKDLAEAVLSRFSQIDYLILNTGITDRASFQDVTPESWGRVLDTNLNVPFFTVQRFSKYINSSGRILFIGSLLGQYPHSMSIPYGVSKSAVHFLASCLTKEFIDDRGITVNCIAPGFTETQWQANKALDHRKRIEDKIALHRFAAPEEIAKLCLAVIENDYINGSVINIDGGYSYK